MQGTYEDYVNAIDKFKKKNNITEEFKQLYTNDPNELYYNVRKSFSEKIFVSKQGTVLSLHNREIRALRSIITGHDKDREKVTVNLRPFDIGILVGLTFGCKASPKALQLMQEHGLEALKRKSEDGKYKDPDECVELNHINNYISNQNRDKEIRAKNCELSNIQFMTRKENSNLEHLKPSDSIYDKIKQYERMENEKVPIAYIGNMKGAGHIMTEDEKVEFDPNVQIKVERIYFDEEKQEYYENGLPIAKVMYKDGKRVLCYKENGKFKIKKF